MSHNLAELPLSRRRALERETGLPAPPPVPQSCQRTPGARRARRSRAPAGCPRTPGAGWPEWVSAELCVADDPLFVRKVVARLKAAVDWQRQRAA